MRIFRGLTFSWNRFLGITAVKRKVSKKTHIPLSRAGREAKVGRMILKSLFGRRH